MDPTPAELFQLIGELYFRNRQSLADLERATHDVESLRAEITRLQIQLAQHGPT